MPTKVAIEQDGHQNDDADGNVEAPGHGAEVGVAAGEQHIGQHREDAEEVDGTEIPPRCPQPQEPHDSDR
jgi:hypothetical protein